MVVFLVCHSNYLDVLIVVEQNIAVNYRLAPQYPFPCALQDLLAACMYICFISTVHSILKEFPADLYLIKPPSDASHQPVQPAHIVVAGDSAGGGVPLALLQ